MRLCYVVDLPSSTKFELKSKPIKNLLASPLWLTASTKGSPTDLPLKAPPSLKAGRSISQRSCCSVVHVSATYTSKNGMNKNQKKKNSNRCDIILGLQYVRILSIRQVSKAFALCAETNELIGNMPHHKERVLARCVCCKYRHKFTFDKPCGRQDINIFTIPTNTTTSSSIPIALGGFAWNDCEK